jgi:hypothetical protein
MSLVAGKEDVSQDPQRSLGVLPEANIKPMYDLIELSPAAP